MCVSGYKNQLETEMEWRSSENTGCRGEHESQQAEPNGAKQNHFTELLQASPFCLVTFYIICFGCAASDWKYPLELRKLIFKYRPHQWRKAISCKHWPEKERKTIMQQMVTNYTWTRILCGHSLTERVEHLDDVSFLQKPLSHEKSLVASWECDTLVLFFFNTYIDQQSVFQPDNL